MKRVGAAVIGVTLVVCALAMQGSAQNAAPDPRVVHAGFVEGRPFHWSHMLAVDRSARDLGLGTRLKLYQRDLLLPLGIDEVRWTFDPLEARNAHLNFNHLGAEVAEYAGMDLTWAGRHYDKLVELGMLLVTDKTFRINPHIAPGWRSEPPVSVPSEPVTRRAATATPEPEDDPPGTCAGFHGLRA